MPTAKTPSKTPTHADDATRPAVATREVSADVDRASERDPLDAPLADPYDNIACTD